MEILTMSDRKLFSKTTYICEQILKQVVDADLVRKCI